MPESVTLGISHTTAMMALNHRKSVKKALEHARLRNDVSAVRALVGELRKIDAWMMRGAH